MSHYDRLEEIKKIRKVSYDIDPIFIRRWSPRAFTGQAIDESIFRAVVEAGRLTPSSSNSQPWRVIYGHRGSKDWEMLFSLLVPFNQEWSKNCGILLLILSKRYDSSGKELGTASFDTGAFWGSMALEASRMGLPLHGMGGFDYKKAAEVFDLQNAYKVEAMAAMGVPGDLDKLSDKIQAREKPSERKEIDEIIQKANRASEWLARNR